MRPDRFTLTGTRHQKPCGQSLMSMHGLRLTQVTVKPVRSGDFGFAVECDLCQRADDGVGESTVHNVKFD